MAFYTHKSQPEFNKLHYNKNKVYINLCYGRKWEQHSKLINIFTFFGFVNGILNCVDLIMREYTKRHVLCYNNT